MCALKTVGFDDYVVLEDESEEIVLDQYEIVSIPNDFNIKTIYDFIESGLYRIPGFQRNFVWDIGRSSRLIESLIIGLPVPQIFLYEKDRNLYQVIDGQQRLMSIYYFIKQRFPKKEKSVELRDIFDRETKIPDRILYDDDYFVDFKLVLKESLPEKKNVLKGKKYSTLDEYKNQFDYRTLRNIMIRVSKEPKENSAIYEIYNRLNTGGINLSPQEIRSSLFYSDYYDSLYKINKNVGWRRILNTDEPSLHLKDVEILLRGFAILIDGDKYTPSLTRFLNKFSEKGKTFDATKINYLEQIFISFIKSTADLRDNSFINPYNNNFNIALYEAVFNAVCKTYYKPDYSNINNINIPKISQKKLDEIANNQDFIDLARVDSTSTLSIKGRLKIAYKILNS